MGTLAWTGIGIITLSLTGFITILTKHTHPESLFRAFRPFLFAISYITLATGCLMVISGLHNRS